MNYRQTVFLYTVAKSTEQWNIAASLRRNVNATQN